MRIQKNIYEMSDRELRIYKRSLRRQRELRRRCMMVFITVSLVIVCAVSYHSIRSSANTGNEELLFKYYKNITVAYGETLWEIADEYIDYSRYRDKETYIEEVRNINHLDENASIRSGQYLIVPYYSNEFIK